MTQFVMVCEAPADFVTASDLVERLLEEETEWCVPDYVTWYGETSTKEKMTQYGGPFTEEKNTRCKCYLWKHIRSIADRYNLAPRGAYDKELSSGSKADYKRKARIALRVLRALHGKNSKKSEPAEAAILLIDGDNRAEKRQEGFDLATETPLPFVVIVGVADPMREAWVLNGFLPKDPNEQQVLDAEKQKLSFDPTQEPEKLTAKKEHEDRHPKRVVEVLTRKDPHREAECWRKTTLDDLRQRGASSGLRAFLGEISSRLVPLLRGASPA